MGVLASHTLSQQKNFLYKMIYCSVLLFRYFYRDSSISLYLDWIFIFFHVVFYRNFTGLRYHFLVFRYYYYLSYLVCGGAPHYAQSLLLAGFWGDHAAPGIEPLRQLCAREILYLLYYPSGSIHILKSKEFSKKTF